MNYLCQQILLEIRKKLGDFKKDHFHIERKVLKTLNTEIRLDSAINCRVFIKFLPNSSENFDKFLQFIRKYGRK